jgi:hypothetical protein
VVRQRIANPLHVGSNPILTSIVAMAWVAAAGGGGSQFQAGTGATDASSPEATAPVDAGASWCTGHTDTFCEDFDEYPTVTNLVGSTAWPNFEQAGGSFSFDTVNAPSPPNALEARGDDGAQVIIVKTFTGIAPTLARVAMTFDLRINSPGTSGLLSAAGFAAIAFGTSISDGYVALAIADGPTLAAFWADSTTANVDGGTFKPAIASGAFPSAGVWAGSYTLEIDYDAMNPTGCVQVYGGPSRLLSACLPLPPQFGHPTVLSIALGDVAGGAGRTGSVNVEFDNVTFDIR